MLNIFRNKSEVTKAEAGELKIPTHLAVIMDGNGRWASARGLPRLAGHKAGAGAAKNLIRECANLGVKYLTIYAFSSENWDRPKDEVDGLMSLLRYFMEKELEEFHKNGAKLRLMGAPDGLPQDVKGLVQNAEEVTKNNRKITVCVALNYGGRDEIVNAAKKLAIQAKVGNIQPEEISSKVFADQLFLPDVPEPDLLIRTGGDYRVSNFMIWQIAYTEFYFTQVLWPDFGKDELLAAIHDFSKRERRYGKV